MDHTESLGRTSVDFFGVKISLSMVDNWRGNWVGWFGNFGNFSNTFISLYQFPALELYVAMFFSLCLPKWVAMWIHRTLLKAIYSLFISWLSITSKRFNVNKQDKKTIKPKTVFWNTVESIILKPYFI